jgi:hypothetical protein
MALSKYLKPCLQCTREQPCFSSGRGSAFYGGTADICRNCEKINKFREYEMNIRINSKGITEVCKECNKTKVSELFAKSKKKNTCECCYRGIEKIIVHDPNARDDCGRCGKSLPLDNFPVNKYCNCGYTKPCKTCNLEIDKERRDERRQRSAEEIEKQKLISHPSGTKHCGGCDKDRSFDDFNGDPGRTDGFTTQCKHCAAERGAESVINMNERSYEVMFDDLRRILEIGENTSIDQYQHKCLGPCGKTRPMIDFRFVANKPCVLYGICYDCCNVKSTEYAEKVKAQKQKMKEVGCIKCGETNHLVLDLAHINRSDKYVNANGKKEQPSHMTLGALIEQEHCLLPICSNHHRYFTYAENFHATEYNPEKNRASLVIVNAEKVRRGECVDCHLKTISEGEHYNLMMFDFDHRPGCLKLDDISYMVVRNQPQERLINEMPKCDLRCSNCHRIKTYDRAQENGTWGMVRPDRSSVARNYQLYLQGQTHKKFDKTDESTPKPRRPDNANELQIKAHIAHLARLKGFDV